MTSSITNFLKFPGKTPGSAVVIPSGDLPGGSNASLSQMTTYAMASKNILGFSTNPPTMYSLIGSRKTMVDSPTKDLYWKTGTARAEYRLNPLFAACCSTPNCRTYNVPSSTSPCLIFSACAAAILPYADRACCDYCNPNTGESGVDYPEGGNPDVLIPTKTEMNALGLSTGSFERSYFIWGLKSNDTRAGYSTAVIPGTKYYVQFARRWQANATDPNYCFVGNLCRLTTNRKLATPFYFYKEKLCVAAPDSGTTKPVGSLDFQLIYPPTTEDHSLGIENFDETQGVVAPKYNKFGMTFVGSDENPSMYALPSGSTAGISFNSICGQEIMLHGTNNAALGQFNAHFLEMIVPSDDWTKKDYTTSGIGTIPSTGTGTKTGTSASVTGTRSSTGTTAAATGTRSTTVPTGTGAPAASSNIGLYVGIGAGVLVLLIVLLLLGKKKAESAVGKTVSSSVEID